MKKRLISLLLALVMLLGLLPTGAFATETGVLPFAVEVDGEAATVTETADTVNCSWCYSEEPIYAVDIAGKQEMTLTFSGCAYAALLGPDTDWDPSNDLLEDYELTEGGTVTVSDLTEGNYLCVYDEETDYCYHLMFKDTSPKFTAAVDGEAMTQIEESVLSWVNWDGSAMSVPCYTVTVPQNTAEVTLTFKSEKQWSSYDSSGNYITGGAECWEAGIEHVVPVQDVDGDGEPDGISVQAPGAYSTEFYIQFVYGTASCLSVKSDAPATGEVAAGGLYQLKMSDVFSETAGHEVQYTYTFKDAAGNGGNVDYTFTKLQDGVLYLTPKTEGAHTLTFTATCSEGTVEHTVALTVGPPNEGIEQQYGYDETDKSSVTVYVTLSNNGMPLVAKDGTILANLEVTVPYFNLELYDLQAYNRYGTDGGRGPYVNSTVIQRPTGLHLYIYLLERYYMGLPEEECCRGTSGVLEYAESKDIEYMDGSVAYNSNGNRALVYSGGATSIFMNEFWGHDCNLMYYRNHCYPYMSPGWGSTSDYILLSDGDAIDVAMFSNWGFYHTGYFASFDRDVYEVAEGGGELTVYTRQWGTSAAAENFVPVNGSEGMSVTLYDSDWNELDWIAYEDEDSNAITVTVPEENGIYYLMAMDPSAGDEEEAKVAPAIARIVVGDQSAGGGDLSIYDECGFISLKDDQDRYLIDIEIGVLEGTEYGDLPTYQVIIEEGTETVYATFASGIEFGEWIATYDVAERTTDYSWDTISFEENEDGTVTVAIPVSNYTDTGTGIILEDSTNAWLYGFDFVIGEISEVQVGTAVSRILLNSYSEHLWIGDDVTLVPTVMPAEATGWTIQWTSSDETVATVDQNGKVTGTGDGAATITAAIGDVKVSCAVTVEAFNSAPSVVSGTLGWNKIKAGQTAQIDVSNWFTDAEQPVSALTYTAEIKKATAANFSQDYDYSTVAGPQVSVNGGKISVTVPEIGTYMLYVTASDGKLTKTHNYQITVINNDAGVFKLNDGVTLSVYHVVPVGYTRDGNDHHIVISKDTLYRQGASTILKFGVTTEEGCAYSGRDSFGTGGQLTVTAKDPDNKTTSHTLYCHKECSGEHKDTDANYVCDSCWMTLPKPGKLALTAVNQNGFIFEPVYVEYETGMTVMEVLESSGHTFAENGSFITSIDGQVDNYSLYYNNGAFDREAVIEDPANVTALWFTTYSGQGYSENLLRLVEQMAAFNASANGVKEYPAAKTAYEAAKKGFYAANETTAGTLYTNLKSAMDDYQAFLDAGTLPLTMEITLGSQAVTAGKAVFTSEFGTVYTFEDFTGVALKPAAYSFDISDGGFRHVRGTVVVEEGALLRAALPEGKWIGGLDIGILSGDNWKAVSKSNATDGSATFYVPDYATTSLYPYITRGEGVDGNSTHKVFLRSNTSARTWESKFTALAHVIEANSLEGTTLVLECIPAAAPADGYEQYQTFTVNIVRTPSLKDLGVSALGAELKLDFVNTTSNYLVKTSGDSVTVTPTALTSGAVITVNNTEVTSGQALEVDLTAITPQNGLYVIPVSVTANGRKTSYTVQVEKTDTVTVTLNVPNGVTAEVFNDAGAKIEGTNGVYRLDKDQTYTYIATFGEYYHATASFKAAEGEQVSVAAPKTENWLAALAAKAGTSGKAPLYPVEPGFDPQTHAYTAQVESNTESFYLQAYAISSAYSTEAIYQSHNNTVKSVYTDTGSTEHAKPGQSSDTYLSMPNFLGTGGWGNEMTVRVTQNTAESGVTYYQDYILTVGRDMTLYTLSAADTNGRNLQLAQLGSTAPGTFQKLVYDYTAKVSSAATSLNLSFKVSNTSRAFDFEAYTLEISGLQNPITFSNTDAVSREHTVAVPLNGTDEAETVTVTVRHSATGTVAGVYTIALTKLPAAAVRFIVDPADATVFVTDNTSGTRVLPESDGAYVLMSGENYTYVISKSGYITQNASFTASAQDIEITLEEAPASTLNDIAKDGDWLQFRADNNNNGVVDVMTPTAAEDAVLEWANKIGDGFDSGATGCPIIVDGYLYTYAGNSIHKINKDTGEIVDSGRMAASSSFAINSPTYAEGMIFVGLSDGRVQAFNAETLDSLWLFTDPLGGQPNCPIVYSDGYIYTGFWNSETKQANFIAIAVTDEDPTSAEETKLAAWSYTHNGFYWAGAYACEDFVLMGTDDGGDGYTSDYASILSVDPKSGLLLDELQLPNVGDQRSSICYDEDTDAYYFTTKGGDFYQVKVNADGTFTENSLRRLHLDNGANNQSLPPMSTSTPVIYNGRAYIGVSGTSQFGAYSGHNMTVIDLETFSIAYCVPTMGYPQTSGLLTTAYEDEEGYVYVYFIDNYTPGMIRVLRDKKGMTEVDHTYTTTSSYMENGVQKTMEGGYILFTPDGDEAQYAICSPVADSEGNLYFKNDSAKLMRLSSRMTSLEITQQPEKLVYCVGETFDSAGMTVTAHYANGTSKDITSYVSVTDEPLTADDTEITVSFAPDKMFVNEDTKTGGFWQWYQDANGAVGQTYYLPTATVTAQILTSHAWNDGEQTKAPTCAGEGNCLYTCTVCGATKNEPVAAVAHSTTKQEAQSATCLEPGIIAHYHCSGCGKNFADESGKTVLDTVVEPTKSHTLIKHAANASTCVGEGTVEYYACDVCHKNFADEAGTKELTTIVDPVTGHSMTKTEAKPASCAEAGNIAYYTCSVCKKNFADESGKTVLDSVAEPAKVHTLTGTEAKPATCTEEGNVAYYTCSGCGKNFADQQAERIIADVTLKAAGHKLKAVAAKEATYTAPGNVAYWSCETCGKLFADAKGKTPITDVVIPQLIRVEEDKATVSEAAVSNLIEEALTPEGGSTGTAQETVEVVIPVQDCTPENAVITSVELPVASVAELVETDKKIEGTVVLTINLGSATVKLDSKALEAVAEQVKGTSVTLILKDIPAEELTQEQQRTLDKYTVAMVITAELIGGDHTSVHDFKGGNVTVHLPFTPPAGTNGSDYTVLYVADDGTTEKIPTRYENGELVFTLKHFSDYAVALDVSDPSVPATGDAAPLAALTLMLLLSVTAFAVTLLSCKKRGA